MQALIPPPKESAGAKVLKKMGWKPGQGIGPRISYRMRRLQDMQAATGKMLRLADIVITEEEEEANKHKYPRRDVPVPVFEKKDNFHGLGYKSGLGLHESLGRSKAEADGPRISCMFCSQSMHPTHNRFLAGFGLGALNDADEDDIDIYDGGRNTSKSKIAYDIAERERDTAVLTQKKAKVEPVRMDFTVQFRLFIPPRGVPRRMLRSATVYPYYRASSWQTKYKRRNGSGASRPRQAGNPTRSACGMPIPTRRTSKRRPPCHIINGRRA